MIYQKLVDVQFIILGMVTSVKRIYVALEVVNIIRQLINVSVKVEVFGTGSAVWLYLIVVVVRFGIKQLFNVIVLLLLIGMELIVYFVWMEKFGIKIHNNVNVEKEPNGWDNIVLLFNNVLEVLYGIKILGHVSVQL